MKQLNATAGTTMSSQQVFFLLLCALQGLSSGLQHASNLLLSSDGARFIRVNMAVAQAFRS